MEQNKNKTLVCNNCQTENIIGAYYCANCGSLLPGRLSIWVTPISSYNDLKCYRTELSKLKDRYVNAPSFSTGLSVLYSSLAGKMLLYGCLLLVVVIIGGGFYFYKYIWGEVEEELTPFFSSGSFGYVNKNGVIKIEAKYKSIIPFFDNGLADVQNHEGKWGRINKKGEVVSSLEYDEISSDYSGWRRVKKNGKYGYITSSIPERKISVAYKNAWDFIGNLALVQYSDGSYNYYNTNGELISNENYKQARSYPNNGWFWVQFNDDKYGFINLCDGKILNNKHYLDALAFYEGYAVVKNYDETYDFINIYGTQVSHFKARYICSFNQGYAAIINRKMAIINDQFELITEYKYDFWENTDGTYKMPFMDNGMLPVSLDGINGYINKKGIFISTR